MNLPLSLDWKQAKLGQVAKIERKSVQPTDILAGTTYVGLEHIDGEGMFNGVQAVNAGDIASNKFAFDCRHLLYGKLRPYLKKIARPDFKGICSTDILPILPGKQIDKDFLHYYLRQPKYVELATNRSTGVNLPRLSPKILEEFPIFFPPLDEQKRIAAILDKADAIRRKRKEAIALTEELLRSTFIEMFGDPITNPKGWDVKLLGEVCTRVTVGYVGSMASEYIEDGIPWLRSLNINRNNVVVDNIKYVSKEFHQKLNKSSLLPEDVVSVRTGNAGVTAVIPDSIVEANCSDLIVMTCGKSILPNFLSETLNMLLGDREGGNGLTGAIQKHFNITRAKTLKIPTPPMEKQKKWVETADKIRVTQSNVLGSEEDLNNLFNSLLQKAFRGEL